MRTIIFQRRMIPASSMDHDHLLAPWIEGQHDVQFLKKKPIEHPTTSSTLRNINNLYMSTSVAFSNLYLLTVVDKPYQTIIYDR
jgi:hypothetical protein